MAIVLLIYLLGSAFHLMISPDADDMIYVQRTYAFGHVSLLLISYLLLLRWPQYTPQVVFSKQSLVSVYFVAASWWLCGKLDEKDNEARFDQFSSFFLFQHIFFMLFENVSFIMTQYF
jgi:hypothetical protein